MKNLISISLQTNNTKSMNTVFTRFLENIESTVNISVLNYHKSLMVSSLPTQTLDDNMPIEEIN